VRLDEAHCPAQAEVPKRRLCPSGEPKEALARRGPDSRMVPAIAEREQDGFDVRTDSRLSDLSASRCWRAHSKKVCWQPSGRTGNQRRPMQNENGIGRMVVVFLDISPHSSSPKRGLRSEGEGRASESGEVPPKLIFSRQSSVRNGTAVKGGPSDLFHWPPPVVRFPWTAP
jgi:hypothetical protein